MIAPDVLGRLKRAVRVSIGLNGGIDGATATVDKCRSLVGNWNNLNKSDTPILADALALDEIAISQGSAPPILSALAAELGHVAICLPDVGTGDRDLSDALIDASAEFGDIATAVRDATRNGNINNGERDHIVQQIDEATASLARLRAVVTGGRAAA